MVDYSFESDLRELNTPPPVDNTDCAKPPPSSAEIDTRLRQLFSLHSEHIQTLGSLVLDGQEDNVIIQTVQSDTSSHLAHVQARLKLSQQTTQDGTAVSGVDVNIWAPARDRHPLTSVSAAIDYAIKKRQRSTGTIQPWAELTAVNGARGQRLGVKIGTMSLANLNLLHSAERRLREARSIEDSWLTRWDKMLVSDLEKARLFTRQLDDLAS